MSPRPCLLDLFCGAGGAAMGYHRAGFDVVGVDIKPQPRYPFPFVQADASNPPIDLSAFDAIHASPPCQDHMYRPMPRQKRHGTADLLPVTRDLMNRSGVPWIIENVPGAPMRPDYELCGCLVGMPQFIRRRWFETSWGQFEMRQPCHHPVTVINTCRSNLMGQWVREHGHRPTYGDVARAMGVDWMRGGEVTQAIPPAYTEYIGQQLISYLQSNPLS